MHSEKAKMLAGEPYDPADAELQSDRERAHALCRKLSTADGDAERADIVRELLGPYAQFAVTPPFFCDYGYNIHAAAGSYCNTNCVLLDTCSISIGPNTLLGPGVHIYTVSHPMDAQIRRSGTETGKPVILEEDVWIGGASVICPGVTIGARTVVGAGSVVTRSLPPDVFAAGNPCRVIRPLTR